MKKLWIQYIPLFVMATALIGASLLFQQWEKRLKVENTVIVDMVRENSNEDEFLPDPNRENMTVSLRHVVDAGGFVLIILGTVMLIVAIMGCRPWR